MIVNTSLQAYRDLRDRGQLSKQQRTIMLWFHKHGGEHTRAELAEKIGMRLSSVCGRVNELVSVGYLTEGPRRRCRVTNCPAHPVKLPPAQISLGIAA